ncbi:hypothetical protein FJZ53_04170 [Candidatus Woesearchaeota archaeon]|nr:hypothetical protein [Candidatus Woesearchaeota archaeon]
MSKAYMVIGILIGAILAFILIAYFVDDTVLKNLSPSKMLNFEKKKIIIPDECGNIIGNVLHSVTDEDQCKMKCLNQCSTIGMERDKVVFSKGINTCNSCECYCS